MTTYVVAVDFSHNSRNVLELATRWAARDDADVVLVHAFSEGLRIGMVSDEAPLDPLGAVEQELRLEEARELTARWASVPRDAGVAVETVAKEADAARLVVEQAKEHDAQLIFIGRRGHGKLRDMFIGSTADAVIRRAPVPVVVVPEQ